MGGSSAGTLSVAPSGRLVVAWERSLAGDDPTEGIYYRERLAGGRWTATALRHVDNPSGVLAALADDGTLDLAWAQPSVTTVDRGEAVAAHRPPGGLLGTARPISEPSYFMPTVEQLVADGVGGAVVYVNGPGRTVSVREAGRSTFGPATRNAYPSLDGSLNVGPDGLVVLAYHADIDGTRATVITRKRPGTAWSAPLRVGDGDAYIGHSPDVAIDDQGNLTVLWEVFINGPGASRMMARTLDAAGPVSTMQAGPLLSEKLRLTPRWSAYDRWSDVARHDVRFRSAAPTDRRWTRYTSWKRDTTATKGRMRVGAGRAYCFSSRAVDTVRITGDWSAESCVATPLDDRSARRSSGWAARTQRGYFAGTFLETSRRGARLSLAGVRARTVGLLADRLPRGGKVVVRIGARKVGTVSLKGARAKSRAILVGRLPRVRKGTLTVTVVSRGRAVRIDGLFVGR